MHSNSGSEVVGSRTTLGQRLRPGRTRCRPEATETRKLLRGRTRITLHGEQATRSSHETCADCRCMECRRRGNGAKKRQSSSPLNRSRDASTYVSRSVKEPPPTSAKPGRQPPHTSARLFQHAKNTSTAPICGWHAHANAKRSTINCVENGTEMPRALRVRAPAHNRNRPTP